MRTYEEAKEILFNGFNDSIKLMDTFVEKFKSGDITKNELKLLLIGIRFEMDSIFDEMIWSNTKWEG